MNSSPESASPLRIGWAEADITPLKLPAGIAGQHYMRVSEGVLDPLKAVACVIASESEQAIFVCCDLVGIPDNLRDLTRSKIAEKGLSDLDPAKVVLNATHSHAAPEIRNSSFVAGNISVEGNGADVEVASVEEYLEFLSGILANLVADAWNAQAPSGFAFGLDYAVVGRNRRWLDDKGVATMYGLNRASGERFRHVEGYEDHSLNLLATYNASNELTGLIVNVPSPSQESEHEYRLSADFWAETRAELRKRFGEGIFILSQCSSAGDLVSRAPFEKEANARMLRLRSRTARQEVAARIADAVGRILPVIEPTISQSAPLVHEIKNWELPISKLTQADVDDAKKSALAHKEALEAEWAKLETHPELREQPRWYVNPTREFRRMRWFLGVVQRFEGQKTLSGQAVESHIIRLGDIAFATNPFEYYLDFGIQIKLRSPALQTFLVQLAGNGTYVPSPRSVLGGGYGSVPASNPVGPEGGQELADHTVHALRSLWPDGGRADV